MKKLIIYITILCITLFSNIAFSKEYNLKIAYKQVNVTGKEVKKIAVNGSIPGPTLYFTEGEDVVINVTNNLDKDSSIHWHGLLLPGEMDGVPGLNGFPGIKPGTTFTYKFKIRQSGTYWYHSHSMGQEQDGQYGSIVIKPKATDPVQSDRDYVILLSEHSDESSRQIMSNLKKSSEYYQKDLLTIGDFFGNFKKKGVHKTISDTKMWGEMRMLPTDLADVTGYSFLTNGYTSKGNWTGIFKKGEKIRLRFINGSAMSFFDVRIPELKMTVVAADGQNIEPVTVDEFRFGVAEIYDVIVTPEEDKAYTIIAEPIDRSGFALSTLAPEIGMKGELPKQRPRTLLTMSDMGMSHEGHNMNHDQHMHMGHNMPEAKSGWANMHAPKGHKILDYKDLRYLGKQDDLREPSNEIEVKLGGNMERYIWTINGKKGDNIKPIELKYNDRVRLKFVNDSMMAHPMHLHGLFFQLENGQDMSKLPNKNVVIIPPGKTYSILVTADELGEWAFHCHLLYHMLAGMMTKVVITE